MTDQDAFIRTICEHPFDLRPRLVYADWLDENDDGANGFVARAEFIRLQFEEYDESAMRLWDLMNGQTDWFSDLCKTTGNSTTDWGVCADGAIHYDGKYRTAEFLVSNGFAEEIRCPLDWWIGGECPCYAIRTDPPSVCVTCHGTGRTPANGPAVVSRQPVTRVVISDREPFEDGDFIWHSEWGSSLPSQSSLPPELCREMGITFGRRYPTRKAAVDALSRALVDWARQHAGLAPIQWEVSQ